MQKIKKKMLQLFPFMGYNKTVGVLKKLLLKGGTK